VSKRGKSLFYIVSRVFVGLPLAFVVPFVLLVAVWTLSLRPTLSVLRLDWLVLLRHNLRRMFFLYRVAQ
jgi:hypothetical protein